MATGDIQWIRLNRLGRSGTNEPRQQYALVIESSMWAQGLDDLIKVSAQYRDLGLLVTNVGPSSRAASAGLQRGDVLLGYDGVSLTTAELLNQLIASATQRAGTRPVEVVAARGDRELTLAAEAGRLGIAVSPMLDRLEPARRTELALTEAWRPDADPGSALDNTATIVGVPNDVWLQVVGVSTALMRPRNARHRKNARALLSAATASRA